MAEDVVTRAAEVAGLAPRPSRTSDLRLHGAEHAHARPATLNEEMVRRAAREEMARTVEDVLARRWRSLFLDVQAAQKMAPMVATALGAELERDERWCSEQVSAFREVSANYIAAPAR
jgi:glycerol-3-phosphate dehydrogenase